jgi:CDP-diglyceride synthetase
MFPIYNYMVQLSKWLEPKSQRCCEVFGVKANFSFGMKALMIADPILIVLFAFFFSLAMLALSLQIFEREVDKNFKHITTAMWNIIITLTTVGYGDYAPKTDFGRIIGIITAFWGIFFLSLFVVALTNTLELGQQDNRAFILLRRLSLR